MQRDCTTALPKGPAFSTCVLVTCVLGSLDQHDQRLVEN